MVKQGNTRVIATITPRSQIELAAIQERYDWKVTQAINEAIHLLFANIDKERR